MLNPEQIEKKSDSLIELLTSQCADLEALLNLAREETLAAQQGNFLGLLDIVSDREKIAKKLETFQRQISELRSSLGENQESIRKNEITKRVVEIANLTISQDETTKMVLHDSRDKTFQKLNKLENSHRGNNAYLREHTKGLAYDQNI